MIGRIFQKVEGSIRKPEFFGKAIINDSEICSYATLNVLSDIPIDEKPGVRFYVWVDGKAADLLWPIESVQRVALEGDSAKSNGMFRYKLSMDRLPDE